MENQHKKITGYRDLTQFEIDLMNEGKVLAELCREFTDKLRDRPSTTELEPNKIDCIDKRWLNIGITDLQKGFMAVIRSVAKPTTF